MKKHEFNQLIQSARNTNLADYFLQSGYTTQRYGAEIYVKEFPGLCIKQQTNQWFYHYENIGGTNAVDCLVNACNHDFKQAVFELTGQDISFIRSTVYHKNHAPQFTSPPKTVTDLNVKKEFQLPDRAENMRRVFAYFCKERKIPAAIIEELAHAKLLYQSQQEIKTTVNDIPQTFKTCNAVFVHLNENGVAVGGEIQGVNSYKRYKGIVEGTGDSVFSFTPVPEKAKQEPKGELCLPNGLTNYGKPQTAYLFESAVDLMSFYAFCKPEKMQGVMLISMAGLKPTIPKKLQEQGVKVYSCVDNDNAGRKFETDNNFKRGTDLLEKAGVKDWNELLLKKIKHPETVKDFVPEIQKKKAKEGRRCGGLSPLAVRLTIFERKK